MRRLSSLRAVRADSDSASRGTSGRGSRGDSPRAPSAASSAFRATADRLFARAEEHAAVGRASNEVPVRRDVHAPVAASAQEALHVALHQSGRAALGEQVESLEQSVERLQVTLQRAHLLPQTVHFPSQSGELLVLVRRQS